MGPAWLRVVVRQPPASLSHVNIKVVAGCRFDRQRHKPHDCTFHQGFYPRVSPPNDF